MKIILLALGLAVPTATSAFSVAPSSTVSSSSSHGGRTIFAKKLVSSSSSLWMSDDSSPSDTASDDYEYQDVVSVESEAFEPSMGEAMVTNVMDLLPSSILGSDVSSETRAAINEVLLKLEKLNPTSAPAVSPLMNGVWELKYVGGYTPDWALPSPTRQLALFLYSGGYSPGVFALSLAQKLPSALVDVGDLELSISRVQPRVDATIDVKTFGGSSKISVKARLEVASDTRLTETYESATIMDRTIDIPQPLQYSRDLYVTYVDDDLLVVRDASGVPEILVRKEKTFTQNWGTDPSALEDMVPPGEEE